MEDNKPYDYGSPEYMAETYAMGKYNSHHNPNEWLAAYRGYLDCYNFHILITTNEAAYWKALAIATDNAYISYRNWIETEQDLSNDPEGSCKAASQAYIKYSKDKAIYDQLATDGREEFWTEEMVLRYAEAYRWSSERITVKAFKESSDWWSVNIEKAKEIAKQIDDGREELEKELIHHNTTINNLQNDLMERVKQITALQSSLSEKEDSIIEKDFIIKDLQTEARFLNENADNLMDQVYNLKSSLKEKEKECDGLKGLCILKDAKIDSQQEKLEELKAENERLNKELNYFHDKGEINP